MLLLPLTFLVFKVALVVLVSIRIVRHGMLLLPLVLLEIKEALILFICHGAQRRGFSLVFLLPFLLLVVKIALIVFLSVRTCWSYTWLVFLVPFALLVFQVTLVVLISDRTGLHSVLLLPFLLLVVHVTFVVLARAGSDRMAVLVESMLHVPLLLFEFAVPLCFYLSLRICSHQVLLITWVVVHWSGSFMIIGTLLWLVVLRLISRVRLPRILICDLVRLLLLFIFPSVE